MFHLTKFAGIALAGAALTLGGTQARATETMPLPEWKDYIATLGAAGDQVIGSVYNGQNPQDRQEAWNLLFGQLSRGWLTFATVDANDPEFVPMFNVGYNIAAPSPDYVYFATPLDGHGVYRLRGNKGSNRFTAMQTMGPTVSEDPTQNKNSMYDFFRLDQVPVTKDGSFDFLLSAERPAGYTGHWVRMSPQATGMFMRTVSYDWVNDRDPVVGIERIDTPVSTGRPSAETIAARLTSLVEYIKPNSMVWFNHMKDLQNRDLWNRIGIEPWGTFPGQVYLEGLYRIADDEALILETSVPSDCLYWSFLVGDMQFRTIDYANHQASLNGFQAKRDRDGKFRAVIAKRDPGVPNWLDTGGYNEGVIQGRWNTCSSTPVPTAKLVKLSQIKTFLPADTPSVSTAERDRTIRDRRFGAQLRRKW